MELTDEQKENLTNKIGAVIASAVLGIAVGAIVSALLKLAVTNIKTKNIAGNKTIAPTEDKTVVNKSETTAKNTDSSLASDEVASSKGELKAKEQEAKAATDEATASETGTAASRVKSGASDVETKSLKMT